MPESDITKRPKRKASDIAHTLAKVGISALTAGVGGELFSLVVIPSLEKRRDKWMESIAKSLKALEDKVEGFKIENLCENESFISTVMQASQAAIRNHQREKLEALKNTVLNAALPNAPEEDLQLIFLEFIGDLTPLHLKVLTFLDHQWMTYQKLEENFSQLTKHQSLCDTIVRDLYSRGLTDLRPTSDAAGSVIVRREHNTTDLGRAFLKFITSPFEGPLGSVEGG